MTETALGIDDGVDAADCISEVRQVDLRGDIDAALGLSGAAVVCDYLILGADEGHKLQVLARTRDGAGWKLQRNVALAKDDQEVDIEAITYGDGFLYVVGSHSCRRRLMKPEWSLRKNLERFQSIDRHNSRNRLYRLPFNAKNGSIGKAEKIDLSNRLRKDPLLDVFVGLPSKENGIDIEGMAYRDGQLHLGFRGPVLRGNHVPVMVFAFDHPKRYALRFVRLQGQGIRDLVALDGGFLIVSGPVNDAPGPFHLWWWDGEDQIPGKGRKVRDTVLLGAVSTPGGAKAEGLALLEHSATDAEVMLVYETGTAAQAVRMRIELPR